MTLLAPRLKTSTHCPYCSLQCAMDLADVNGGLTVTPRGGGLCQKGWTSVELLSHPQRLTAPLMRAQRGAPLLEVGWDVALDRIAGEFRAVARRHGPDAVGVFGGGGLTNEKAYALGKFARVALRSSSIDYNGRFCMSSAAAAGTFAFGLDRGLPFPLADIARADVLLLVGSNLAETMPPAAAHLDDQQLGGGRLIVVDPRASPTARRADLHLQIAPGTDLALALGLLHIVLKEHLVDTDYVERRTGGFERAAQRAGAYWPDRVERICGVPVELLRRTAHLLAEGPRSMILTGRGPEQQSQGSDTVSGFINLALALGMPGRAGSGYGCLTGQGNGQGGREHGQKADQLPGYRRIDDPAARAHVAGVWGVDPDALPGPGRSAYELLDTLGTAGGVRALLVMGSNVVVSAPNAGHVQERLDALDFLAVSDLFLSETAERADVVLPVAQWAEEEGTMTNLEGRVIIRRAAVAPPAGVRTDLEVLSALAARLGCPVEFPTDAEAVFEELRRASAGGGADYAGISYARIARDGGTFWPCPQETAPDAPRVFLERFATENGRARFRPVNYKPPVEPPDAEYPLWLTTGRVLRHYQSGTQTRRVPALLAAEPEPFVELHPVLARRHRIADGDQVAIASRRGEAFARARVTPDIRADTVFMPFHWPERGRANLLTNPVLDPRSRMPEFKLCAVRIEAARPDLDEETKA